MSYSKIGALLRIYSPHKDLSNEELCRVKKAVEQLLASGIDMVQFHVWAERDNPQADCGSTDAILTEAFRSNKQVEVYEAQEGDLFVSILNKGVEILYAGGMSHALILSYQAASCITPSMVEHMRNATKKGAKVVTVALKEIAPLVEQGMVCNSCALWDIEDLLMVSAFDPRDTKPRGDTDHYADSPAGVGEILPLLAIRNKYCRPVHAILHPDPESDEGYLAGVSPEKMELNRKKFESKERRLLQMLKLAGYTMDDLRATIIHTEENFLGGSLPENCFNSEYDRIKRCLED